MNRWMGQHKTEEKTPNRGKSIKVVATISLHLWTLRRICALFVARRDTPMHCLNKERERGRLRTCDYETLTNCKCHSWHSFANCFMYNLTLCGHNIVHHKTKMVGGSIWMLRCGAQRCGYDQIHDMTRIFWENSYQTSIFPGMGRCPELLVFQIFTRCLRSSWSNASSLTPCTAIRFPGWLAFVWRPREIDSYGRANEERRRIEIGSEEWDNDRFGTFDFGIFGNSFLQWNWRCHRLIKVKTSKHPGCLGRTPKRNREIRWPNEKVGTRKNRGGPAAVVAPLHGVPNTLIQNHPAASVFVVLTLWNLSHQHLWIMYMRWY